MKSFNLDWKVFKETRKLTGTKITTLGKPCGCIKKVKKFPIKKTQTKYFYCSVHKVGKYGQEDL